MAMTRTTKVIIGVVVAGLLVTGTVTVALAQADDADGCGMAHRPIARLLKGHFGRIKQLRQDLNVTAEQRSEIKGIVSEHKQELREAAGEVIAAKRALREATLAENPDEATIRAAADQLGDAIGDAAVIGSKVAGDAREVLTSEQIAMLEQARADGEAAVDQWLSEAGQ
jgi:Spy/CpxP family protein refolding chaperone